MEYFKRNALYIPHIYWDNTSSHDTYTNHRTMSRMKRDHTEWYEKMFIEFFSLACISNDHICTDPSSLVLFFKKCVSQTHETNRAGSNHVNSIPLFTAWRVHHIPYTVQKWKLVTYVCFFLLLTRYDGQRKAKQINM